MTTRRRFRFGVMAESVRTREELLETAHRAEELGYATFLLRDHFIEEPFGHQLAPLTALATVAALTTTLRVGSMVFAHDFRHPVMLAKECATLDVLSGGRFELGLGAGFSRPEYDQAGLLYDPPGVRVERFGETVRVLKQLLAGGRCSFTGRHHTVSGLESFPASAQRPHPPILIGAGGRRMLAIAAREADSIGILTASIVDGVLRSADATGLLAENVAERVQWVKQGAGERFGGIELSLFCSPVISEHQREAAEQVVRSRGWSGVSTEQVLEMPSVFIGPVERIVEQMLDRRERYGFSYYIVSDRGMQTLAPAVARLAGT